MTWLASSRAASSHGIRSARRSPRRCTKCPNPCETITTGEPASDGAARGRAMSALDDAFQAVLADPEDDAARLAFADACEATDPRRADYIRSHISYDQWLRGEGYPAWADRKYR